jgi:hypothetical protein
MKLNPDERKRLRILEQEIEALHESIDNFATELVRSGDPEREQLACQFEEIINALDPACIAEILRPRAAAKEKARIFALGRAWEKAHPEAMAKCPRLPGSNATG